MRYFDHAATGFPKSGAVIDAVKNAMEICGNPGRGSHEAAVHAAEAVYGCREAVGALVGCPPEHVVLTPNTTFALNEAINGLIDGGRVIMSPLEHNSVCRPLYALEKQKRVRTEVFDMSIEDDRYTVECVKKLCRKHITAAVFTHASNVCGRILPVRAIADAVHDAGGIVILDAAQSAGHIDVTFDSTGADVICLAGHKRLGGPLGTGAMALSGRVVRRIKPFVYGGSGIASLERDMPGVLPERMEAGTLNAPAFAGLAEAIRSRREGNEKEIFRYIVGELKKIPGVVLYGCPGMNPESYFPVLLFNSRGMGSDAVAAHLSSKGICVRSGWHCSPLAHRFLGSEGGVRISIGESNTHDEARELVRALTSLAE